MGDSTIEFTYFGVDGSITPISKYRKQAWQMLTDRGYSPKDDGNKEVSSSRNWFKTMLYGLEYLLSRGQRPLIPNKADAFLPKVTKKAHNVNDYPLSKKRYRRTGRDPYGEGNFEQKPDHSKLKRAFGQLTFIYLKGRDVLSGKLKVKL